MTNTDPRTKTKRLSGFDKEYKYPRDNCYTYDKNSEKNNKGDDMNFFEKEMKKYFTEISIEYKYTLQYIDDTTIILISKNQSLMFTFDREGVDFDIILKNKFDIFEQYPLSAYIILERFKSADDFPHESEPENFEQRITLSLCIFSYGLYNYCKDILAGDTAWLKLLKYKDPKKLTSNRVDKKLILKIENTLKNNIFSINRKL